MKRMAVTLRMGAGLSALVLALFLFPTAWTHPASGMPGAQGGASGDTLARRSEKLLFYERSFRPSTYDAPMPAQTPSGTPVRASSAPAYLSLAAPETVQGFRIQVINTNSYEEAAATRNTLLAAFDTWWVYVMFDTPTYRVRMGDFASRLAAKRVLEQVQTKGFPNAWLVPDKVVLHLAPRLPLPEPIDSALVE